MYTEPAERLLEIQAQKVPNMDNPSRQATTPTQHQSPEGDDPVERARWLRRSRVDSKGRLVPGAYLRALRQKNRRHPHPLDVPAPAPAVNWTPIGPSVIAVVPGNTFTEAGRVTALVAGPGGQRVYAGGADGGVWISTNAGLTWTPLNDYFTASDSVPGDALVDINSLSVGAIEVRFGTSAANDEIFVGTGEANMGWPALFTSTFGPEDPTYDYFGVGINHWVGGTWTLEATNLASQAIYRIAIDPNDATPTNVYAATTRGLFKRPIGGADPSTWNPVPVNSSTPNQPVTDFIAAGSGAGRVFYAAVNGDNVYSSTDGATWMPLSGLGALPNYYGRIALAASESNPNIVYALVCTGNLYRLDTSAGNTFQQVPGVPGGVPYGAYGVAIAVDPTDPNTIYLGGDGNPLYQGSITITGGVPAFAGGAPTYIGTGIHADTHAITFAWNTAGTAHDPTNIWVGCDGGVYQSSSSGASGTFRALNLGLAISQCYSFGQRSDTDAVVVSGLQDNGGLQMLSQQAALMSNGIVGDGGSCVYHPADPYQAMMQFKKTGLTATTDGGATWTQNTTFPPPPPYADDDNSENGGTAFVAPLAAIADSSAPGGALLAFGTDRLWLSQDWGVTWVTLPTGTNPYEPNPSSPNLTQDVIAPPSSSPFETVNAIAFASPTQAYAATANVIWRYDFSGGNWSNTVLDTSAFPSGYFITGLAVEDAAAGSIYVSLGGGSGPNLWYFDGTNWHPALPASVVEVPTHAVVVDPTTLAVYAGTDVGCWKGVKSGSGSSTTWTWTEFSNGLPQCAILQLSIHQNAYLLRAATCGRGVWEIPLDPAAIGLNPDIYMRVNYADTGRLHGGSRYPWVEGAADPINVGDFVYHWMSADIKVRRSSLSNLPAIGSPATYLDFAFNVGDYAQPSTDIETADLSGTDTIFVEVHNRSVTAAVNASNVRVLLLVADASAALPALPSGWTSHVNSGDTDPSWLGSSGWSFVDASQPYQTLLGDLDVRTPQVVTYEIDFSTLNLPTGHDHVCLAAFVSTVDTSDQITSSNTDLNTVTMTDKHVVHRNLHLVALGAEPQIRPAGFMALNFNNPYERDGVFDIAFNRTNFPGRISLLLPKLSELSSTGPALDGFQVQPRLELPEDLREIVGGWVEDLGEFLERLGREIGGLAQRNEHRERRRRLLDRVDRHHVLLAESGPHPATITGVQIAPHSTVTAVFALSPPPGARKNDRYRLDVIQRHGGRILGGSSYVIAIV